MSRFLAIALLLAPLPMLAHESPSHNLKQLELHLAETPDDPVLLRQKADLLMERRPNMAAKVVAKLMRMAPDDPENRLLKVRVDAGTGNPDQALADVTALVVVNPRFVRAWKFRSNLEDAAGHRDEAIAAKRRYLELVETPDPSEVLTCAGWLRDRGQSGDALEAVRVLDRGLSRLGCLTGLHEMAIDIELTAREYDAALKRVDLLEARYRPTVALSLRRAEILEKAGRYEVAAAACDSAIAILDLAPAVRKQTPAYQQELEAVSRRKAENLTKANG